MAVCPLVCVSLALGTCAPLAGVESDVNSSNDGRTEPADTWYFGSSFDQIADVDGDCIADLIVVDDRVPNGTNGGRRLNPWRVVAVSGASGEVIWSSQQALESPYNVRKFVKAWADWDQDGIGDVLLGMKTFPQRSQGEWSAKVLSGKTGAVIASLDDLPELEAPALAIATRLPESENNSTIPPGLLLERRARETSSTESAPFIHEEGKKWDTLGIWSLQPKGLELVHVTKVRGGGFFSSRPAWVAGKSVGEVWGVACLVETGVHVVSSLRLIELREGEGSEIESNWLGESGARFSAYARLSAVEVGDINGDGVSDVAVGATGKLNVGIDSKVVFLNGATGRMLHEILDHGESNESFGCGGPREWGCGFACSVASLGDLDEDGCSEILVGSKLTVLSQGSVIVFNPCTGKPRDAVHAWGDKWKGSMSNRFGSEILTGLDFDGDGTPDFVTREDWWNDGSDDGPGLYLYSGATLELIRRLPALEESR